MKKIKNTIATEISDSIGIQVEPEDIEASEGEHGDFAYPAMKAASELGEPPREIAEAIREELSRLEFVSEAEVAGPGYVNLFLERDWYASEVLETLGSEKKGVEQAEGEVLLEFSCPNLAKPMHVGHMRNNCLGDSLQRILRFRGYDVTSENYIGDWGTKHGQVIYGYKLWGSEKELEENPMDHMYDLYVKINQEADEETQEKAREWTRKIEEGDKEARELWEKFRKLTIEHNEKDYRRMDIHFDRVTGESVVAEEADSIVKEGLEKGIFEKDDDGSVYVDFEEEELPSTVVKRDDGVTLYLTRDIANIRKRASEGFDQNLYVVATEQNLHFKQLFSLAEDFGIEGMHSEHVSYGMLHLEEGSMSSSKGNIIRLEEVLDEARERASKVEGREVDNAEAVGQAAIKYANLKVSRGKDIEFSWDRALSFEGDSGPYLQYSNTRAKSILKKTDLEGSLRHRPDDTEYALLKKLSEFPEKVERASRDREPAKIANYLSELCERFNTFYHSSPVLDAPEDEKRTRLALVETFVDVTDTGLELLGIEPLDEM